MEPVREVPIGLLLECLELAPDTGVLTWKHRPVHHFSNEAHQKTWNGRNAGKQAFCTPTRNGYLIGTISGKSIYAHRVAFAMHNGRWPSKFIDHINGDKKDNRIANLRECDHTLNGQNRRMAINNTSGYMGVTFSKQFDKWAANIKVRGKNVFLGYFCSAAEAGAAYLTAKEALHTYPQQSYCAERGVDIWEGP